MANTTKTQALATSTLGSQYLYGIGAGFPLGAAGEFLPALQGTSLLADLRRMFLFDDTVSAMTWLISTTLQQLPWKHEARIDGKPQVKDAEAVRMAEFADTLLIDMTESWASHVEQCCELLWSGFLPFEIVLKQRKGDKGRVKSRFNDYWYGVRKMPLLDPLTINGWVWDTDGDLTHMLQSGAKQDLPIWKVALYQTFATDQNPAGRSMLQGAWRSWRLKTKIQDSEAIGIDRDLCGLPWFKLPEAILIQADEVQTTGPNAGKPTEAAVVAQGRIQNAIKAVSDMRFNRTGGLITPSDTFADDVEGDKTPMYDFKLVTTAGSRSIDTRLVIRDYDRSIARSAMMQFLHLGDRSTGSYALSDDQSSMAMRSLSAFANIIGAEWSTKVLTLVWEVNGFDKRYLPHLQPDTIGKEGLTAIGAFLRGVGAMEALWSEDEDARASIGKLAGIKTNPQAQKKAAQKAAETKQPTLPGIVPAPGGNDEDP